MRKFLVVGCGGSGGATLAYMMDQLRSDLADHGIDRIPAGWQFVHIDVPLVPEKLKGVGRVDEQGGTYVPTGPQGGQGYSSLDTALTQRFLQSQSRSLDTVATWLPREPNQVQLPLSEGAGQYRALGRAITLSQIDRVNTELRKAWERLMTAETNAEMRGLSVPGLGAFQQGAAPIVLVVSSMAGGAGASMALDVCRVLSMIPGLSPGLMGVFMVTPDIFRSINPSLISGVPGNALAMFGEIVASQTGSARQHDVELLRCLGLDEGAGAPIPFARVFPIGGSIGADRAPFGNGTPDSVYRGLARGLVALMLSENATKEFTAWDLTNNQGIQFDRDPLGWGAKEAKVLAWGAFGFASLSMGRDRYKEYASQRLARSAVHHLLHGHEGADKNASDSELVKALLDNQWPSACARLGLPPQGDRTVEAWLTAVLPLHAAEQHVARIVGEAVPEMPSGINVAVNQWVEDVGHNLARSRPGLQKGAQHAAYLEAFRWQNEFASRLEAAVTAALAEKGMPYATALLKRVRQHLEQVIAKDGALLLSRAPGAQIAEMPEEVRRGLAGAKGVLANAADRLRQVMTGVQTNVRNQIYAQLANYLAVAARAMTTELIDPMVNALDQEQRLLREAEVTPPSETGLAYLRTDEYTAWPSEQDAYVAKRFAEADNEVMLTSSEQFKSLYEMHLPKAAHVDGSGPEALRAAIEVAVGHVISGYWETQSGHRSPSEEQPVVQRTAAWRSSAFPENPETGQATPPQAATYAIHVRPSEILDRARKFVARPGEELDKFCAVSLREYVVGSGDTFDANEPERRRREQDIATKFAEALALAQPLVAVDDASVQTLHGKSTEYRYKFSAVPFAGLPVAGMLEKVLNDQQNVDETTRQAFPTAFVMEPGIKRIDIFGSYPNYSPLSYTAVIEPAIAAWQKASDFEKKAFWTWRRSRPLAAALPMHEDERRAMVGGWLLGQAIGFIQVPGEPYIDPVSVWDAERQSWVAFPNPLLTARSEFKASYDILPAVLESVLLAIARCHQSPVMSSMRPYHALRSIWDSSSPDPDPSRTLSAVVHLTDFIRNGYTNTGVASAVAGVGPDVDIDERGQKLVAHFTTLRDFAGVHFMRPGEGGPGPVTAQGGGTHSRIDSRAKASGTPMFRDIAPDVFYMSQQLINLIPHCVERAKAADQVRPAFIPVSEPVVETTELPPDPGFGAPTGSSI